MSIAISNTSPLLYLYRINALTLLSQLFSEIWIPSLVVSELKEGHEKGYDVLNPSECNWLKIVEPRAMPSDWFALNLGMGELAVMSLALENPNSIVLLDDALARRIAQAAGLNVWGTLRILLQAKSNGLTDRIAPLISQLKDAGLWISDEIHQRILTLAGEE